MYFVSVSPLSPPESLKPSNTTDKARLATGTTTPASGFLSTIVSGVSGVLSFFGNGIVEPVDADASNIGTESEKKQLALQHLQEQLALQHSQEQLVPKGLVLASELPKMSQEQLVQKGLVRESELPNVSDNLNHQPRLRPTEEETLESSSARQLDFHFDKLGSNTVAEVPQSDVQRESQNSVVPSKGGRRGGKGRKKERKNPKDADAYVSFDAIKARGKFKVELRIYPSGTMTKTRKSLLADKNLAASVKAKILALPERKKGWVNLNGDKSKHPTLGQESHGALVADDKVDTLPSERSRCLPYAFVDLLRGGKALETYLFSGEPKGSLDVCDMRQFADLVKRKLDVNLEKVRRNAEISDPARHKRRQESWLTYFKRQETGKYLLVDRGHAFGIDCELKLIYVSKDNVASLELLNVSDKSHPRLLIVPDPGA
jgi:hypothetical protein